MKEIHKVLAAICFSSYCEATFDLAATLADKFNARLLVANVINVRDVEAVSTVEAMGYEVKAENYIDGMETERLDEIHRYIERCGFPEKRVKTIFRVGVPFDELMKIIEEEEVDLVVIGTKGRTNLAHVLVGSVAEKLFRHSPVTIISNRERNKITARRWTRRR